MKRIRIPAVCLLLLLLAGCAGQAAEPVPSSPPAQTQAAASAPEVVVFSADTPAPADAGSAAITPAPAVTAAPVLNSATLTNLLTDADTLRLVSFTGSISLYADASMQSDPVRLVNDKTLRSICELIVLDEEASPDGKDLYHVRAAFSGEEGYVFASATHASRIMQKEDPGYALLKSPGCPILFEPKATSAVLTQQSDRAVRILGEYRDYYYIVTEDGVYGFVDPMQVKLIDRAALMERLTIAAAPAIASVVSDPLTQATAANAAKMLRVGVNSASVAYWDTAQSHATNLNRLKKAAAAMLSNAVDLGQKPVGREGIQFLQCLEVPPLTEGEELQQGLDFNLHGSVYTGSPLVSVTAEFASLGKSASVKESVTFDPAANVTGYSLENSSLTLEQESLNTLFDISALRAGRYRFTLSAATAVQPNAVTLLSVECKIIDTERIVLTQNKFDDNYYEALKFFGGNTDKFVFHYSLKDSRGIATENDWRNTYIVESSLGRVHRDAVPYFETANHYLENTYICVTCVNPRTGNTSGGDVVLLKSLIEKETSYVPRFQSNLEYVSHHTLGTAIDVNDNMYPNFNILTNHDLIGDDVKNHLTYNGIQTDASGIQYYDFTYDGTYPASYKKVPNTIVNYLLYELAFYRAGFEWGFYYETTCDAMHFMLTENDRNRHMHTDIGLRKVYEYIDPEWVYVPTPSPSPTPAIAPKLGMTPTPAATPAPTPTPKK